MKGIHFHCLNCSGVEFNTPTRHTHTHVLFLPLNGTNEKGHLKCTQSQRAGNFYNDNDNVEIKNQFWIRMVVYGRIQSNFCRIFMRAYSFRKFECDQVDAFRRTYVTQCLVSFMVLDLRVIIYTNTYHAIFVALTPKPSKENIYISNSKHLHGNCFSVCPELYIFFSL